MKKHKLYRRRQASGFTIVELLIVVVVIAILAAITIVTYNGIQERARTVAVASAVDDWQKLIMAELVTGNTFSGVSGFAFNSCLGRAATDFPAENGFAAGQCFQELDNGTQVGSFSYNAAFFQGWSSGASLPYGNLPVTKYKFDSTTTFRARGAWISINSSYPDDIYLRWIPQIANQCGRGVLLAAIPSGNTYLDGSWCQITIKRNA